MTNHKMGPNDTKIIADALAVIIDKQIADREADEKASESTKQVN